MPARLRFVATSISPPPEADWVVGNHAYSESVGDTFNVQPTGPAGYAAGGIYGIDASGSALPSGVTLAENGLETYDGVGVEASAVGVKYRYSEPGALSTLTLEPALAGTNTLPYMGTVYPPETVVPSGQILLSPDDANFRSSVISTYPDGSARIIVVAGETSVLGGTPKTIRVRPGAPNGTDLTPARIQAILTNANAIQITFSGGTQTITNTQLGTPEFTWWKNPAHICCRYRLSLNNGVLQAVIDIHAFKAGVSNRAFVEGVIENALVDSTLSNVPDPADVSYTGGTIVINGTTIVLNKATSATTIDSTAGPNGTHGALRAFYFSAWVGGDPQIEVTHDTTSMQAHPMLYKPWKPADAGWNFQTIYGNDNLYKPWFTGTGPNAGELVIQNITNGERLNVPNMSGYGDAAAIGPLMQWDAQYLQTGNKYVSRASIAVALSALACNINIRDQTTGLIPTLAQMGLKGIQTGTWPNGSGEPVFENAHAPAVGLMAFLCRPSPCFIELAQKAAIFQQSWSNSTVAHPVFYTAYQVRGKAWTIRSWNHAIFLTPTTTDNPNVGAWTTACKSHLYNAILDIELYKTNPINKLGFVWDYRPLDNMEDQQDGTGTPATPGYQYAIWEFHFMIPEMIKGVESKLLDGAQHTKYAEIADWAALQPVRFVNEAVAGEWRSIYRYQYTMGDGPIDTDHTNYVVQGDGTYNQHWAWWYTDSPPALSGPVLNIGAASTLWSDATTPPPDRHNSYDVIFFSAFVAAVERAVPGADTAWNKFVANITDFDSGGLPWSRHSGFAPKFQSYPRNK